LLQKSIHKLIHRNSDDQKLEFKTLHMSFIDPQQQLLEWNHGFVVLYQDIHKPGFPVANW
jgi:hypothetical protein